MSKQKAESRFRRHLKDITKLVGHSSTTYTSDLHRLGKHLFGSAFKGVYSSDRIPKMQNGQMAILNLDRSDQPGSHWISVVKYKGKILVYDSFGRKASSIIPSLGKSGNGTVVNTELDADQKKSQDDCGNRVLASLLVFWEMGPKAFLWL